MAQSDVLKEIVDEVKSKPVTTKEAQSRYEEAGMSRRKAKRKAKELGANWWLDTDIIDMEMLAQARNNLNLSLLDFEYPFTLAHEMGHLAGVTSEAEANYWGFVFCRDCLNAAVRYSGYQAILPYVLSNAWNLLPEDEFNAWKETVCLKAREDYSASRQFWIGKRVGWIDSFQSRFYNLYLRSNGISEGLKDYFGVVEMIMTMDASRPSVQQ